MKNVALQVNGSKLVITCDLSQDFGPSKSGKTTVVASTEGFIAAAPGIKLGLNLIK